MSSVNRNSKAPQTIVRISKHEPVEVETDFNWPIAVVVFILMFAICYFVLPFLGALIGPPWEEESLFSFLLSLTVSIVSAIVIGLK